MSGCGSTGGMKGPQTDGGTQQIGMFGRGRRELWTARTLGSSICYEFNLQLRIAVRTSKSFGVK